jgi:hypothetical protein
MVPVIDVHDPALADDQQIAERVVRAAIEAFRMHPFHDVDPAVVAELALVSRAEVERAFPMWDALLMVTYDRWVELRAAQRTERPPTTLDHVRLTLQEDLADPGLVRVLAGVINVAGANTVFAELFRKRYAEYHEALTQSLRHDFESGAETAAVAPEHAATQLLALYEGFQIQILVRPDVDVLAEYDRAVQTLRQGWGARPVQTWDLAD